MLWNCYWLRIKEQIESLVQRKTEFPYLTTIWILCGLGVGECNFNLGYWWDNTDKEKLIVQNSPLSVPNNPKEIPHGMAWIRSWTFVESDLRVTAWNMTQPLISCTCFLQVDWEIVELQTPSTKTEEKMI